MGADDPCDGRRNCGKSGNGSVAGPGGRGMPGKSGTAAARWWPLRPGSRTSTRRQTTDVRASSGHLSCPGRTPSSCWSTTSTTPTTRSLSSSRRGRPGLVRLGGCLRRRRLRDRPPRREPSRTRRGNRDRHRHNRSRPHPLAGRPKLSRTTKQTQRRRLLKQAPGRNTSPWAACAGARAAKRPSGCGPAAGCAAPASVPGGPEPRPSATSQLRWNPTDGPLARYPPARVYSVVLMENVWPGKRA